LGCVVAAAFAVTGTTHAFSALQVLGSAINGRIGVQHLGQRHAAGEAPGVHGRSEASSSAAALGAALLCMLSVAAVPVAAAQAEALPLEETSVQVLGEDGAVLGEAGVPKLPEEAPAPDAPRRRKGMEPPPKAPEVPAEERARRREAASETVMEEMWYKRGKVVFVAKCAGCHPAGANKIDITKTLYWDDMERNGYRDYDKIWQIIRYGKGKMPGYAEDCASVQDYTQCGVVSTLDDETLVDVQDFMINRANAEWKGRG